VGTSVGGSDASSSAFVWVGFLFLLVVLCMVDVTRMVKTLAPIPSPTRAPMPPPPRYDPFSYSLFLSSSTPSRPLHGRAGRRGLHVVLEEQEVGRVEMEAGVVLVAQTRSSGRWGVKKTVGRQSSASYRRWGWS
jgi:hypothetical protein